ncbi:MAG: hypothetical protein LUF26_07730 [Firmicutes bacterium]|nr:hypothetical protein [Bacillota bacterium]
MEKNKIVRDLVISLICFAAGIAFGISQAKGESFILQVVVSGAMLGGLWYGWQLLTFITPNVFLIMPIIGWVIFFLIKLILSLIIAPFAFVFKTITNIIALAR